MGGLFHSKAKSIGFVVAMLILLLLVCMLLITLTQMSSMNQRADALAEMIKEANEKHEATQELIDYMQTNDYIIEWALQNNRIHRDDISWIQTSDGNN